MSYRRMSAFGGKADIACVLRAALRLVNASDQLMRIIAHNARCCPSYRLGSEASPANFTSLRRPITLCWRALPIKASATRKTL